MTFGLLYVSNLTWNVADADQLIEQTFYSAKWSASSGKVVREVLCG